MMERHRGDRDRDRNRDRDYRDRDRDRSFHHQNHRRPSRFSDGPPLDNRRSPSSFRVRSIDSPPPPPPPRDSGNFHHPPPPGDGGPPFHPPMGGPPGGFWPMGGDVGGGFGNEFMGPPHPMMPPHPQPQPQPHSLSGQKRGFPFASRGGSPDTFDGKSFVKLFVGSVPRSVTEDEIRPLFEEQGNVMEVALIKDKRTGQQQGLLLCCSGDGASVSYVSSQLVFATISGLLILVATFLLSLPCQTRRSKGCRPTLSLLISVQIGALTPALLLVASAVGKAYPASKSFVMGMSSAEL